MRRITVIISIIVAVITAYAQNDTTVSLVTAYPGTEIYELEGHEAIRINMGPEADYAVSYGVFDFNAPGFVYRFVKGETDYMVALIPWSYFEYSYRNSGRRLMEKQINMTSAQKQQLLALVEENLQPENRVYRYNYVKDNCATRPLRMVERALGDSIILGPTAWDGKSVTFRDVMRKYHKNYPWYQFGIDLALGSGIDYKLDRRELAFAPVILDAQLDSATVGGKQLVLNEVVLLGVPEDNAVLSATPWYLSPMTVCWLVFVVICVFTWHDQRKGIVTKWLDAVYFGMLGLAGCLLTFLIFVSVHEATSPNWLYVWLNPFCLIPPVFIWLKKCKKVVLSYQIANFVALLLLCLAWPLIPQSANAAFWPLIIADLVRAANYITIIRKNAEP